MKWSRVVETYLRGEEDVNPPLWKYFKRGGSNESTIVKNNFKKGLKEENAQKLLLFCTRMPCQSTWLRVMNFSSY